MEKIIWSKNFDTDIEIIDFQHKILVERINELKALYDDGSTQEQMFSIIVFLDAYANYHFKTEETFFLMFNYGEKENHIAQHNFFKSKIKEFKQNYHNDTNLIDEQLISFLSSWLKDHILETDKKFADGLKKHIIN